MSGVWNWIKGYSWLAIKLSKILYKLYLLSKVVPVIFLGSLIFKCIIDWIIWLSSNNLLNLSFFIFILSTVSSISLSNFISFLIAENTKNIYFD